MEASVAGAPERAAIQLQGDPTEARLVERVIAVARALLSMAAVLIVRLDPPEPSHYVGIVDTLLIVYAAFALILLVGLVRATTIPENLPLSVQTADVGFATLLTLVTAGPNSPLFTFLLYPLLAAAYRWGFREVMITACIVDALMGVEAIIVRSAVLSFGPVQKQFELNGFILRAIYIGAMGAAVGYLAENEKRRRLESRDVSFVLTQARLGGKFGETLNLVLESVRRVFRATQVLLVLKEQQSGRVWLWVADSSGDGQIVARPEQLAPARYDDYLFETPGDAWHAVAGMLPRHREQFRAVAVDELGRWLSSGALALPAGFIAAHPVRRLIGVSLRLSDTWTGRLFVLAPGLGIHREQSARFALQLAKHVGPVVYGHYLVRRLRTHAESLERGRIARELHDGVTQSLLGLEMELVVLHRRAAAEAPELADDLARVHRIVRNEVITVRELMEGIRVGDVEAGDLLHHLSEVVDRFGRYTGIAARFVSNGDSVTLTPHVRRQVARIVHEALVNVRKHSGANRVLVRADVDAAWWKVSIEDDGQGFPFAGRRSQEELEALRQGPRTIGERVRIIGGTMVVESKPGFGARVEVAVPLKAAP
jgi:signal transduction histidine kinase